MAGHPCDPLTQFEELIQDEAMINHHPRCSSQERPGEEVGVVVVVVGKEKGS